MAYPAETRDILVFMGYEEYDEFNQTGDFIFYSNAGEYVLEWKNPSNPQPTEEEFQAGSYAWKRDQLQKEIESNRIVANQKPVDVRADPGLDGLMDESNAAAITRQQVLDQTPDEQLVDFDPTLNPAEIGSVAAATSLYWQEVMLFDDPSITADQQTDLTAAIASHKAIVQAGDDTVDVPEVPKSVRTQIGVALEGYGFVIATRIFQNPWWYPEFELRVDREIDVSDYWMAVYDGTGTYMSTPFLTEIVKGEIYKADWQATNLPRGKDFDFQYTLCYRHITNEQFDLLLLPSNSEYQRDRVRWSGITDPDMPRQVVVANRRRNGRPGRRTQS